MKTGMDHDKNHYKDETGIFYALDLGGTNFRVLRVKLGGGEKVKKEFEEVSIPPDRMIGKCEVSRIYLILLLENLQSCGYGGRRYANSSWHTTRTRVYLFLSCETIINCWVVSVLRWTKGFNIEDAVGQDIVEELTKAYVKALNEDPQQYRADAEKLKTWGRAQNPSSLVDFSSKTGEVEDVLKDIAERAGVMGVSAVVGFLLLVCFAFWSWRMLQTLPFWKRVNVTIGVKEGKSVLERFKLSGPDGSNYWVSQEAQIGGSDKDNV